uniref:C-type lectin domain-containing protein n=1 Tax=Oryzias latipes TaxID=8090 RepID=A0A3P9MDG2_ORYLA
LCSAAITLSAAFLSLWTVFFEASSVLGQDLQERDAICNAAGCYVAHFQRKIFLDSWRTCKQMGGNLATIKRKEDAAAIASLFSTLDLRHSRSRVRVWIGLQRQPRQCTPARPLRGFSWTTGDQDTQYTNWQNVYSVASCMVPRCVALRYGINEHADNFKWIDGSCSVPVDGFLCHYSYRGMEGQPVLCTLREDGHVGCMCEINNGGCEQLCRSSNGHFFCECFEGYELRCLQSPCQQICENTLGSFLCSCRKGFYQLYDGGCEDIDECLDDPCDHDCENTPGSFICRSYECYCKEGYELTADQSSCVRKASGQHQSGATTPYYWVTNHREPAWDVLNYDWSTEQSRTGWSFAIFVSPKSVTLILIFKTCFNVPDSLQNETTLNYSWNV